MRQRLGIKRSGLIVFSSALFLMLLFPPWRKVGVWREQQTGTVTNSSLNRSLNRWWFGYIPQYHPLWNQPVFKEDPSWKGSIGFNVRFTPAGPIYELGATQYTIDWLILLIQTGLVSPLLWLDFLKSKEPAGTC